jgi:tetratricopeptide (TPR) repeat protein
MALLRAGDSDAALAVFAAAEREAAAAGDAAGQSSALRHESIALRQRSRWDEAAALAARAADVARAAGLREPLAEALNAEAGVYQSRGDFDRAEALLADAFATTDNRRLLGVIYANTGSIAAQRGDFDAATRQFLASAGEFRRCGYALGEATVLNNIGRTALDRGNARVAAPLLRDALGAAQRAGDAEQHAIVQRNLAEALWLIGELGEAGSVAHAALETFTTGGNAARSVECLRVLGEIAEAEGDRAGAIAHWRTALAVTDAPPFEHDRVQARLADVGAEGAETA